MTKPKILNEEPMSIAEVKDSLAKIKDRDKTLTFRGNKTEEYANQFAFLSSKKAAELSEKLEKLKIPRLKEQHIKKLVDVLPTRAKDVKTILQGYTITVKADDMKKIADAVNEFAPKK